MSSGESCRIITIGQAVNFAQRSANRQARHARSKRGYRLADLELCLFLLTGKELHVTEQLNDAEGLQLVVRADRWQSVPFRPSRPWGVDPYVRNPQIVGTGTLYCPIMTALDYIQHAILTPAVLPLIAALLTVAMENPLRKTDRVIYDHQAGVIGVKRSRYEALAVCRQASMNIASGGSESLIERLQDWRQADVIVDGTAALAAFEKSLVRLEERS